ncbi:hypothetical protein VTN31DRAFT_5404 [Thermomyces dupontii]|uniref:uncharacterized protein n=1 Tax=Talaromyces thermophilus TaxID=28565 RepID=UPI0037440A39
MNVSIAYYESWASQRSCNVYTPFDIDPTPYTHLNFAFALIDDDTSEIRLSSGKDTALFAQLKHVQFLSRDLQLWISVGGYAVGAAPFSKLASTADGRRRFVESACRFMDQYGFDGMDLDWEFPAVPEKGGSKADRENLVALVKDYRSYCKNKGLSVAVPGGKSYMHGFDFKSIVPFVDWLNIMAYDLHGPWEKPSLALPHTNLTDIHESIQSILDAGVSPEKIVLGLANYGKTFELSNDACNSSSCPAKGPGKSGPCSGEPGSLYRAEIHSILEETKEIKPVFDRHATVKYFSWDKTQWVSFDDKETIELKMEYAARNCFAGILWWAVDMSPREDT